MNEKIAALTPLQQAYLRIKVLERKLELQQTSNCPDEIAVIGISCNLPGDILSSDGLWDILTSEKEVITKAGLSKRWGVGSHASAGSHTITHAGLLTNIAGFDNGLFHISNVEANFIDPQHRQLLMVAYKAFEDAAIPIDSLRNSSTGVFVGIGSSDYGLHIVKQLDDDDISPYFGSGNSLSGASGRLSYFFGCKGPCLSIDTACSSSLVAIHQACTSLRNDECTQALVAGTNLLLSAELQQSLENAGMLSDDGHCKAFDTTANGYVRSEGSLAVVLKKLHDAQRDGDRIYACIKGSAIAQDGASAGLTVPNPEAQAMVILQAIKSARITVDDIDFIEAHGTGTSLGDPIEIEGLRIAFGGRERAGKIKVGSIKSNLGHLEAAAGIAGFAKACLSLYYKVLPKHLHYSVSNHHINWGDLPLEVNDQSYGLEQKDKRLIGGVSSFGFTGSIAHCIVAENILIKQKEVQGNLHPAPEQNLQISADSVIALERLRLEYLRYLEVTEHAVDDICYTATTGRSRYKFSLTAQGRTKQELASSLAKAQPEADTLSSFKLGKATGVKKVTLPNYPFELNHFWVGKQPGNIEAVNTYGVRWVQIKDVSVLKSSSFKNGQIYLMINQSMYSKELKSSIFNDETDIVICRSWGKSDGNEVLCGADQLTTLCRKLNVDYPHKQLRIIFDITDIPDETSSANLFKNAIEFLNCINNLAKQPASITLLTLEAFKVIYCDNPNAMQFSLATLFKSAALEMKMQINQLDITRETTQKSYKINNVAAYFQQTYYNQLAIRQHESWYPLLSSINQKNAPINIDAKGTYLITGGNGSLGRSVAQWLLANNAGKIIITGRTLIPSDVMSEGNILYRQLDVSDESAVQLFKKELDREEIKLNGIIHAAGISHQKYFSSLEISDIEIAFSSKVNGLRNIAASLCSDGLDFFIAYSSIASVWGSGMLSHYAAANAYMDAYVETMREKGIKAKVLNWGPWAESNMVLQKSDNSDLLKANGINPLTNEIVAKYYGQLFDTSNAQTIFVQLDAPKFVSVMEVNGTSAFWDDLRPAGRANVDETVPERSSTFVSSLSGAELENYIKIALEDELKNVLGIDSSKKVLATANFSSLGFDSILVIRYVNNLKARLHLPVTTNMLFNYPCLELLSKHIMASFYNDHTTECSEDQDDDSRMNIAMEISNLTNEDLAALIQSDVQKYL